MRYSKLVLPSAVLFLVTCSQALEVHKRSLPALVPSDLSSSIMSAVNSRINALMGASMAHLNLTPLPPMVFPGPSDNSSDALVRKTRGTADDDANSVDINPTGTSSTPTDKMNVTVWNSNQAEINTTSSRSISKEISITSAMISNASTSSSTLLNESSDSVTTSRNNSPSTIPAENPTTTSNLLFSSTVAPDGFKPAESVALLSATTTEVPPESKALWISKNTTSLPIEIAVSLVGSTSARLGQESGKNSADSKSSAEPSTVNVKPEATSTVSAVFLRSSLKVNGSDLVNNTSSLAPTSTSEFLISRTTKVPVAVSESFSERNRTELFVLNVTEHSLDAVINATLAPLQTSTSFSFLNATVQLEEIRLSTSTDQLEKPKIQANWTNNITKTITVNSSLANASIVSTSFSELSSPQENRNETIPVVQKTLAKVTAITALPISSNSTLANTEMISLANENTLRDQEELSYGNFQRKKSTPPRSLTSTVVAETTTGFSEWTLAAEMESTNGNFSNDTFLNDTQFWEEFFLNASRPTTRHQIFNLLSVIEPPNVKNLVESANKNKPTTSRNHSVESIPESTTISASNQESLLQGENMLLKLKPTSVAQDPVESTLPSNAVTESTTGFPVFTLAGGMLATTNKFSNDTFSNNTSFLGEFQNVSRSTSITRTTLSTTNASTVGQNETSTESISALPIKLSEASTVGSTQKISSNNTEPINATNETTNPEHDNSTISKNPTVISSIITEATTGFPVWTLAGGINLTTKDFSNQTFSNDTKFWEEFFRNASRSTSSTRYHIFNLLSVTEAPSVEDQNSSKAVNGSITALPSFIQIPDSFQKQVVSSENQSAETLSESTTGFPVWTLAGGMKFTTKNFSNETFSNDTKFWEEFFRNASRSTSTKKYVIFNLQSVTESPFENQTYDYSNLSEEESVNVTTENSTTVGGISGFNQFTSIKQFVKTLPTTTVSSITMTNLLNTKPAILSKDNITDVERLSQNESISTNSTTLEVIGSMTPTVSVITIAPLVNSSINETGNNNEMLFTSIRKSVALTSVGPSPVFSSLSSRETVVTTNRPDMETRKIETTTSPSNISSTNSSTIENLATAAPTVPVVTINTSLTTTVFPTVVTTTVVQVSSLASLPFSSTTSVTINSENPIQNITPAAVTPTNSTFEKGQIWLTLSSAEPFENELPARSLIPSRSVSGNTTMGSILKAEARSTLLVSTSTDGFEAISSPALKVRPRVEIKPTADAQYQPKDPQDENKFWSIVASSKRSAAQARRLSDPIQPGITYPNYKSIPKTSFSCDDVNQPGYYADPLSGCQGFHRCDNNGGKYSFFCPEQTLFSQVLLVCDYWYNVNCIDQMQYADYINSRANNFVQFPAYAPETRRNRVSRFKPLDFSIPHATLLGDMPVEKMMIIAKATRRPSTTQLTTTVSSASSTSSLSSETKLLSSFESISSTVPNFAGNSIPANSSVSGPTINSTQLIITPVNVPTPASLFTTTLGIEEPN